MEERTRRLWESAYFSTSVMSMPSRNICWKCVHVSSKLAWTMGRGGMVLARRRCSFVLNASGTGLPRGCCSRIFSRMPCIWIHGVFSESGLAFLSSMRLMALRNATRSSSRRSRAVATSALSSFLRDRSSLLALCSKSKMGASLTSVSKLRSYVFMTKSSSWNHISEVERRWLRLGSKS